MRESHPPISFYNTLSREVETFAPLDPVGKRVNLYVCGPTVYDEAHLGHARCYITWDVLVRFLRFAGYDVNYVRNITDVDDKILARAKENNESPEVLATRFTERFHAVMTKLNVAPPNAEPKATAFVPQMIDCIQTLLDKDVAYIAESGTVYYDTAKKADYGNLVHQSLDDLQSGARVEVNPEKHSPLDFALWKPASPDEPLVYAAPWGPGRPGWHIECTAMSLANVGAQLDIHAGGLDLIFPHHQNEIAQSEACTGKAPFAKYWMHNGFVNVSGEKMSKSLGNFATINTLLETYDANTIRYFLLQQGYRTPVDFNDDALIAAQNRILTIYQHLKRMNKTVLPASTTLQSECIQAERIQPWLTAMANDLNTAAALREWNMLFDVAVRAFSESVENQALSDFLALSDIMGFNFTNVLDTPQLDNFLGDLRSIYNDLQAQIPTQNEWQITWSATEALMAIQAIRSQVRAEKNWVLADMIRDRLKTIGIRFEDHKDGTTTWIIDEPVRV